MQVRVPALSVASRDLREDRPAVRILRFAGGPPAASPSGASGGARRGRIRALPDRSGVASACAPGAEAQRPQQSLQVGPRSRGSALAHDHQYVETPASFGEGFEGVPGDSTARAVARCASQARLLSVQIDRDILGRPPCVYTLLDGHQDVRRSKPVQRRCRTARDATTCPPALVAERIGGNGQNLAGIHQLRSQVAPRPIPPRGQGDAVAMT